MPDPIHIGNRVRVSPAARRRVLGFFEGDVMDLLGDEAVEEERG